MATKKLKGLGMGLEALLGPTVVDAPPALAGEGGAPSSGVSSLQDRLNNLKNNKR